MSFPDQPPRSPSLTLPTSRLRQTASLLLGAFLLVFAFSARANFPAAITTSGAAVTVTPSGSGVTVSNGIVSIVFSSTNSATINKINYTYNNGNGTKTTQMMAGGTDGGMLYWETGGFGGGNAYSVVTSNTNYAELDFLSNTGTAGVLDIHYSMLRGSPGFYVTGIWAHRSTDAAIGMGETRTNIYAGSIFNWMSVDPGRNKLMEVSSTDTVISVAGAPKEVMLWVNGIYNGLYEDKYKYSADFGSAQYFPDNEPQRVWGWSSVGTGGSNIGLWDVNASQEYYNCGPMKRELMSHMGTTILNMFNGDHYFEGGLDANWTAGEVWTKVYGPYFVYCNNTAITTTNSYTASQALYNDALAQGAAEASGTPSTIGAAENATAWPYGWFNNSAYAPASQRGTITGQIVISDSGNPNASAANLYVGVIDQPQTSASFYDFQTWMKTYQYWTRTDASGNFTIPNVSATNTIDSTGTPNYTLYAFGPGAESEFMSQAQTGGNPPVLFNLPATQFSVPVVAGSTTNLGTVTWTPTRVGPTVFEIGYPDRTGRKFRHGDDYWVGDIGASSSAPSSVWSKFLEYPFDFPNGMTYAVGTTHWSTGWNFVQPVVDTSAGSYNSTTGTIQFTLPSTSSTTGTSSLYIAFASNFNGANIVSINGTNISAIAGAILNPVNPSFNSLVNGYLSAYENDDSTIREGISAQLNEQRITFPSKYLKTGTNINTITMALRQVGGTYFANHFMYDYIRLEMTGYVPPAPISVVAYAGNASNLVAWPVTPGATSYSVLRSTTSGSGFGAVAIGVTGPVCGSDYSDATWLDTTATNGGTYYYEVQSANVLGSSTPSPQSTATSPSASITAATPAAPTNIVATPGNGQVALSWTASTGANYYVVQRSTLVANGGGTYNTLGTITLSNTTTATTYTDSTPTNGSTYSYAVSAINASGSGAATSGTMTEPLPAAPTAAPTVTVTGGYEQMVVNWSAAPGATGYVLAQATSAAGPFTIIDSYNNLTATVTGLADNTTYYFTVAATNAAGTDISNVASDTTAPASPTVTTIPGNAAVTLTWSAVPAAKGYVVEGGTVTGGPYTTLGSTAGTAYTNSGLTNGVTYYYVVSSSNANGVSALSAEVSATPSASAPVAPTLSATGGLQQVALSWTPVSGATSYTLLTGTQSGGPYSALISISGTTYTETGLPSGTYYYVMFATASGVASAYSNQVSANTSGSAAPTLTWTGANGTAWDTTTQNWSNAGSATTYADGDAVSFPDTSSTASVVIASTVSPASITFNDSTLNYAISSGTIAGTAAVTKFGSGTVTFNNTTNSFTGGVTVNAGTLALGFTGATGGSVGTGAISLAQGTELYLSSPGNNFPANPIQVVDGATVTIATASGANSYGGAASGPSDSTIIISGALSLGVSGSAQFANFAGLVDILSTSSIRFSSTGGANGNGGANTSFQVDGNMFSRNPTGAGGIALGSLSGAGGLQGPSTATGVDTYFIGSNNLSTTFTGTIANGADGTTSINKVGTGTLILTGDCSYTGATTVTAGILEITGTLTATSGLTISGSGSYYQDGGKLNVAGSITNNGIFKISGSPAITLTGAFTNNGVLDLINTPSTLPFSIVNNGTVLTSGSATAGSQATLSGSTFSISIPSYIEHTYQLERATSLASPTWTLVGTSQAGTGSAIVLQDPAVTGSGAFYKVFISP
jgi:autotransporter-associated beta strand protein